MASDPKALFMEYGLASMPGIRRVQMPLKDLKAMMLVLALPVLLNGRSWNVKNRRTCPGIYEVWLEARDAD